MTNKYKWVIFQLYHGENKINILEIIVLNWKNVTWNIDIEIVQHLKPFFSRND